MAVRDPILFEIIKNAFGTAAEEMGMTVVRGAYSTLIKESGDASSAILDREGKLVAQSIGAPLMHLASIRATAVEILKDFPASSMRDGDVFLMNDQYRGGIHSNDIVVLRPVFIHGGLEFLASALVHVADLGGISAGGLPATATEYFHEGLMLPPVKFWHEGVPDETLTGLLQANSRTPVKVMGDLNALIGATGVGANRLRDMAATWGMEEVTASAQELIQYTDLLMRQGIERIPDGIYEGSYKIDDDGIDSSREYVVRVSVQVSGHTMAIDFTGTDPQSRGPINAAYSQAMSGVVYAVRCFLDPNIPMTEGCFTPLDMNLPLGTLVNPRPPAPCNARMATVLASIEAILSALSKAFPGKAVAASGMNHVFTMNANDGNNSVWVFMDNDYGGLGARSTLDGVDAAAPHLMGAHSGSIPVEAVEQEYPVRYESYRLLDDSGGPGAFRGGLAVERSLRILVDGEVTVRSDRMRYPPPGIMEGDPGAAGSYSVNLGMPGELLLPSKKTGVPLNAGDIVVERTSGGGGYGNPLERDPQTVLDDVLDRKVSPQAAADIYGVVLDSKAGAVDIEATERLRAGRRR